MRYEKGRKDASRRKIIDAAAQRFRQDGIAATGLAAIMSDAGMTNGAFYPHFKSKSDLVRETVVAALCDQTDEIGRIIANGGVEAAIGAYLSPEHRDNPDKGCTFAALLPELARQPPEVRGAYAERFLSMSGAIAGHLAPGTHDPETAALAIYAVLVGALQLARAFKDTDLSDRILDAGAEAARALARSGPSLAHVTND